MKKEESCDLFLHVCRFGEVKKLEVLLELGFDVNLQDKSDGMTALIIASMNGHSKLVEMLLEHGADVNIQNKDGWTALMMASNEGYQEVIIVLLQYGADVNMQNKGGGTALMLASNEGHKELVEVLLEHGANVNMQNKDGRNALMRASKKGHEKVVEILLKYGTNIDIRQKDGFTAMMMATSKHKEIAKMVGDASFLGKPLLYDNNQEQEDNTLILNDNKSWYNDITLYQNKVYSYSHSPDYCSQYSRIYEYKMDLFTIYGKLLEDRGKNDGEKEYYDVKKGIVLENDIIERYNKDKLLIGQMLKDPDENIQALKQECQWHEITFREYKQRYFILSKHPEIISRQELIKYFRGESERIRIGMAKVKGLCHKYGYILEFRNKHGLGEIKIPDYIGNSYDFLFLNHKDKVIEQRDEFNREFDVLLKEVNCDKFEIERSDDIMETLNGYLT